MSIAETTSPQTPAPPTDLGDRIARLAAEATVREHQLIRAIGEFECSGQWANEGAISCAQWLSWRIGMSAVASRERVRVAKTLAELPMIDAAFAGAQLSYSKVRALTRVASADNEAELLEIGLAATATQCERICRTFRKVMAPGAGAEVEAKRRVSLRQGEDGTVRVSVVLPADEGARLVASIDSARELLDREEARGEGKAARHSRADGLAALVEGWFSGAPRPRRGGAPNEVVLHVTADALRRSDVPAGTPERSCRCAEHGTPASPGSSYIDNLGGVGLDHETARRLACDASLVPILESVDGDVLDVGRKRRTVPPAITRALEARQGRKCAFPGCEHTLFLDHHHIEHWADGGETKVDNLLLLCRHHHTFVHEHGWTIAVTADGTSFIAPSGRWVEAAPRLGPVDLVALQDHLPGRAAERALCATGGWEPVDYPEIIHTLAEATVRGARRSEVATQNRAMESLTEMAEIASTSEPMTS